MLEEYPGAETLNLFVKQGIANTKFDQLSPYEYVLELLDVCAEDTDRETAFKQYWELPGVQEEYKAAPKKTTRIKKSVIPLENSYGILQSPEHADETQEKTEEQPEEEEEEEKDQYTEEEAETAVDTTEALQQISAPAHKEEEDDAETKGGIEPWSQRLLDKLENLNRIKANVRKLQHQANTEAGLFAALTGATDTAPQAFKAISTKLADYETTLREKIKTRYGKIDGVAAKAEAFEQKIIAQLQ